MSGERPRKKKAAPSAADELRRLAEDRLDELSASAAPAPEDLAAALHELRVHQIELEMQNDELRRVELELEAQRRRYFTYFDLAPVGYVTLDDRGIVRDANRPGALLLGVEGRDLVGRPFRDFVSAADRDAYGRHLAWLKQSGWSQSCDVRLQSRGAEPFWARLEWRLQTAADGEPLRYHIAFTDVHERVEGEEALRLSEERLTRAVEGSGVGLWEYYVQSGEAVISERWADIVGYTPAELAPLSVETLRRLCHPDDLQRSDKLLGQHFSGQTPLYECEARMRHKDGHWIWVLDRGKVTQWGGDGRPLRMTGTLLDITARKLADEALGASEAKFRGIVERATDGIAILQGSLVAFVNEALARMAGYSVAELTGGSFLVVVQAEDQAEIAERVRRRIAGEQVPTAYELTLVRKDGTPFFVEVRAGVVGYEGGPAELVLLRDISERKQAAEALRRSEALLRGILDNLQDAYVRTDADGRFVMVSPSAARMYGYDSTDEMIGLPATSLYAESSDREAMFEELLRLGSVTDYVGRGQRKDGSTFAVSLNAQFYRDDAGNVLGSEGFVRDVTERTQAEEAQRESAENFRAFFDAVDDIIGVAALDGRFIYANPAMSAKLGYSAAELLGTQWLDLYPRERRAEAVEVFAAMSRGERDSCSLPVQAKSGALLPVETRVWYGRWDGAPCIFGVSKDLTTEEETLRKFDSLFAGTPALMALSSQPEQRFTDVNDVFLDALGYAREEVIGHTPGELGLFVEPEEQSAAAQQLQAYGRVTARDFKVRRKDGSVIDGLFSGELIGSPGRQYLLTALIDQGKLKQAESALAASEESYRALFAQSPIALEVFDAAGRLLNVNPACLDLFGVTDWQELRGFDLFADPNLDDEHKERLRGAESVRYQGAFDFDRVRTLGLYRTSREGVIWLDVQIAPMNEPLTGYLVQVQDITESKLAEKALHESEEGLRSLFGTMAEGVVLFSADGRIVSVNSAAESILRLTRSEIQDLTNDAARWQLLRADGTPMPEEEIPGPRAMREKRAVNDVVAGFRQPDGSVSWMSVSAAPLLNAAGELDGLVVTFGDVSALKRAEQELLESLALQQTVTGGVIAALERTIEARDPYTAGHQRRVGELAAAMALEIGLAEERAEGLRVGGMLHDVGKIIIPAEMLAKPGLLSLTEFDLIKGHPQAGYEILAAIHFPWPVAEMALQHHERQDGSGYPAGLSGDEIPLEARILAVADVVEAMASHRPYRPALGIEAALAEVHSGAGTGFDAEVVAACERVFAEGFVFSEA